MGYRKISNLYQSKDILLFKQCFALEKIHGTSAHVTFKENQLHFFSGGAKHDQFVALFNQEELLSRFQENSKEHPETKSITVYGEAYGGKLQGMKDTYGPNLKFIAFEVLIDDVWQGVLQAEKIALKLGLEFVHHEAIDVTEDSINAAMLRDSVQAVRNGCGSGKMREGIVLRPLVELNYPNGGRIICKHKRPEFAEREHTPKFSDPEDLKVLNDAKEIADEWVTMMRLTHVLDAFTDPKMEDMNKVIKAMIADIYAESVGEVVQSKEVNKCIGKKTAKLFQEYLKQEWTYRTLQVEPNED